MTNCISEKILDSRRHITLYCIKQYSVNPTFHPFYEFPIFSVLCNRLSLNLSTNISCFIPGLSSTDRSCKQQLDTLESSSHSGKPFSWSSVVTVCDNFGQVVFHKGKPHEKGSSQFSQLLGQYVHEYIGHDQCPRWLSQSHNHKQYKNHPKSFPLCLHSIPDKIPFIAY